VNGVMPSGGSASHLRLLASLGCRVYRMVAVVVRTTTIRVILVVMAPSIGTEGVVLQPLVCSCGGAGVQKPGVVEPSVEELCMEEPIHFWQGQVKN
jgi:hypothetical protein